MVAYAPNHLDVFATAFDGSVDHVGWNVLGWGAFQCPSPCWQQVAGGFAWQGHEHGYAAPVAIASGTLAADGFVTNGTGDIDVFVQGTDRGLWATNALASGDWAGWSELTSYFRTGGAPGVASRDGYTLQIAVTGFSESGNASVWFSASEDSLPFPGVQSSPPGVACGVGAQPCCNKDACDALSYCDDSEMCRACGGHGQPECPPSSSLPQCQDGLGVVGGECGCSIAGAPPCPGICLPAHVGGDTRPMSSPGLFSVATNQQHGYESVLGGDPEDE